jgi:hypothetical protein
MHRKAPPEPPEKERAVPPPLEKTGHPGAVLVSNRPARTLVGTRLRGDVHSQRRHG